LISVLARGARIVFTTGYGAPTRLGQDPGSRQVAGGIGRMFQSYSAKLVEPRLADFVRESSAAASSNATTQAPHSISSLFAYLHAPIATRITINVRERRAFIIRISLDHPSIALDSFIPVRARRAYQVLQCSVGAIASRYKPRIVECSNLS